MGMNIDSNRKSASSRLAGVFSDVHFWVPVIVLIAGLLLLSWIS